MASEDSTFSLEAECVAFPADRPHSTGCHFPKEVLGDTRMFQHLARFCNGHRAVAMPFLFTVIVTAAIDRGFGSRLITPPLDLPASGRRHPLYVRFRVCRELCFW
jgi:hypothetical protein